MSLKAQRKSCHIIVHAISFLNHRFQEKYIYEKDTCLNYPKSGRSILQER